ncbi:unnamed protein product [Pneumocystis jirovecii]|uniref:Uncharacterized protein n=1 Tax=Pneumocystis jirovecii TaxID=42068 RepID=L0PGC6_PNEJI|nr:unnamed protein product [Pneumocystis jirovecii]
MLKNTLGGVVTKLVSMLNWTYTSVFGKTGSSDLPESPKKNDLKQLSSDCLEKDADESMFSASLAPHLLGYTPQAVRIRQDHFKNESSQEGSRKQGILTESAAIKKQEPHITFISSYNTNGTQKTQDPLRSTMCTNKEKCLEYNIGKVSPNKVTEFSADHTNYGLKNDSKKLQRKNNSINNHMVFDWTQWPRNSSTGILTAWREICRQQEITLKNSITELQLCKSKSMFIKENTPMKNLTTNLETKLLNTKSNDTKLNDFKKEKRNIIQIPEKHKNFHNRFNASKNNVVCTAHNLQTNNIENLKSSKRKNIKPRKISESYRMTNFTSIQDKEINHKRNKSCNFLQKSKEMTIQKENSSSQPANEKPVLNYNVQENRNSENINNKNIIKSNEKLNTLLEISNSQNNSLFVNSQHKRKRSGYFSALEEDLEEIFGPYDDIDDDRIVSKRKKYNETNDVDFKGLTNNLQKRSANYQQPYFQPRMPLLKESIETNTPEIQNSHNINNTEKSNLSIFSLKTKQMFSDKNNDISNSESNLNTQNNNIINFTEKSKDNKECKISQFNTNTDFLTTTKSDQNDKKLLEANNLIIAENQTPINITNSSQHNLNDTSVPFSFNLDKENPSVEKEAHKRTSISSNQQFTFNTSPQKNEDSLNEKKVEPIITSSFESFITDTNNTKLQNTAPLEHKVPVFTFNTNINKASDVSQIDNVKQTNNLEKKTHTFSLNTNTFQQSHDLTKNHASIPIKSAADTVMEMDSSPEKKETESQSKLTNFNFTTPVPDTKNILFEFKNNQLDSFNKKDSKADESLKLNSNKDAFKQETSNSFTSVLKSPKIVTNTSEIFVEKSSQPEVQNDEQKTLQSNKDNVKKVSSEQSFSIDKSSELSNLKNVPFSFKPSTTEDNKSQTSSFSFFESTNNFTSQEKQSAQTNTTSGEQKDVSSSNKHEFNFTKLNQSKSTSLESNQTSAVPFAFGQNTPPVNTASNVTTTPIFSFGTMNQPKQEFSFGQSTPNTFSFQTTSNNPPVFQFGGNENKTNTHEFTFNLNNPTSSGSLASPSSPFVFGQSITNSLSQQTAPSFNFGVNTPTLNTYSQFQPQTQTPNTSFSFGTHQNTVSQESGVSSPNPFAFTFNTPQSSISGRKIAAPKSRLRLIIRTITMLYT